MIDVIFEVEPSAGKREAYLDLATEMRPMLQQIDGFISVERFLSLTQPDKRLSLSFFADEEAICRWRTLDAHLCGAKPGQAWHLQELPAALRRRGS